MTMDICVQNNINIENATNFETTQGGVYWEGAKFVFFCLLLLGFTLRVKYCGTIICIQEDNKDAKEIATNAPNYKIQLQNLQVDQYWNQILDLLRHSSLP